MADTGQEKASSENVQYHIEIKQGQSGNPLDGEIMLVLDLDGQELPASVAQTIMEFAQSGGQIGNDEVHVVYADEMVAALDNPEVSNVVISDQLAGDSGLIQVVKQEELTALGDSEAGCVTLWQDSQAHQMVELKTVDQVPHLISSAIVSNYGDESIRSDHSTIVGVPVALGGKTEADKDFESHLKSSSTKDEGQSLPDIAEESDDEHTNVETEFQKNDLIQGSIERNTSLRKPVVLLETLPQKVSYSCEYCCFSSESEIDMGKHAKFVHQLKKPYKCLQCKKTFEKELSLQVHSLCHETQPTVRKAKKGFYICPLCEFQCMSVKRLEGHFSQEHSPHLKAESEPTCLFTCLLCRFACVNQAELTQHRATQRHQRNEQSMSVCPQCRMPCRNLEAHTRSTHSQDRPYLCTQCGYRARQQAVLNTHMLTHLKVREFPCPTCQSAFKSSSQLQRHMKYHDAVKKFLCSQCPYSTHSNYEFKRHLKRVHAKRTVFDCKHCEQTFLTARNLKLHAMSAHQSKDQHYCIYCNFSCVESKTFRDHVQKHTADKSRFFCPHCDFTTPWQCRFKRHLNTHSKVTNKTFACPLCDYSCWEKMNLKKHMTKHSTERPFACDLCDQKCKMKHQLDEHKRVVHSGLRPYRCNFCNYTAKTPDNLRKHLWIHENIKPYKCPHCAYASREMSKVRRHANKKHKVADSTNLSDSLKTMPPDVQVIQVYTSV